MLVYFSMTEMSCQHTSRVSTDPTIPSSNSYSVVYKDVPLMSLITNPQHYDGQKVRSIGYMHLEFEGDCIYLRKEDYKQHIEKNGLWLEFKSDSVRHRLSRLNDSYVIVEGIFDNHRLGHMDMNSGSIKDINLLDVW